MSLIDHELEHLLDAHIPSAPADDTAPVADVVPAVVAEVHEGPAASGSAVARLLEIAARNADQLTAEAEADAEKTRAEARDQAEALLADARREAEQVRDELARTKRGLDDEIARLRREEQEHRDAMRNHLNDMLAQVEERSAD